MFERKIVAFFLSISFNICCGSFNKRTELVFLSTHNIFFGQDK